MRNCCVLRICRAVPAARSTRKGTFVFPECFVAETGRRRPAHNSTFLETQMSVFKDAKRSRSVCEFVHPRRSAAQRREVPMLYAILAYHVEAEVMSWTPEEDAALMADLLRVHDRLIAEGRLGPAARLDPPPRPSPCGVPAAALCSTAPLPRPRSSCWASTSSTAPAKKPRSRPRATCAAPIQARSTKSARCPFIFRE